MNDALPMRINRIAFRDRFVRFMWSKLETAFFLLVFGIPLIARSHSEVVIVLTPFVVVGEFCDKCRDILPVLFLGDQIFGIFLIGICDESGRFFLDGLPGVRGDRFFDTCRSIADTRNCHNL